MSLLQTYDPKVACFFFVRFVEKPIAPSLVAGGYLVAAAVVLEALVVGLYVWRISLIVETDISAILPLCLDGTWLVEAVCDLFSNLARSDAHPASNIKC